MQYETTIREADNDDLAGIRELVESNWAFEKIHEDLHADFWEEFMEDFENKESMTVVADLNSELIGYSVANLYTEKKCLWVEAIFVNVPNMRKGVGRSLFAKLNEWGREHERKDVKLSVFLWNTMALDFWKKQGFQKLEELENQNRVILKL